MRTLILALVSIGILGVGLVATPSLGLAQTSTSTNQALLDQITALLRQLNTLQTQIDALKGEKKEAVTELKSAVKELKTQLKEGDENSDVAIIQALLAADPAIYPEGRITGHFGALTKQAVRRLQKKYGLAQPGRVGPLTLKVLNDLLKQNPVAFETDSDVDEDEDSGTGLAIGKKNRLCAVVPPGKLIASGWIRKMGGAPVVPECQVLPPGIVRKLSGATSTPPTPTSTPDTTAPIISGIGSTVSTTEATVSWTTNEAATGKVYYGAASPVDINATSTATVSNSATTTGHSLNITGLTASTTYYFVVESADAAGNKATSSERSFTTRALPAADTTAPVISGVSVSASSTSATVSFTTNESATGKVYYGTVTSLNITATSTLSISGSSVTSHSIPFSGLTASTTYYYVVEAKDAAMNIATTTEASFVTTE